LRSITKHSLHMTNCVRLDLRLNGCFKSWGNDTSKPVGIN